MHVDASPHRNNISQCASFTQELAKFLESLPSTEAEEVCKDSQDGFDANWSADKKKALRAARMLPFSKLSSTRDVINALHRLNLGLQSQQRMFRLIEQYVKFSCVRMASDDLQEQRGSELKRELKQRILALCSDGVSKSGIAGEIPVHVAYLMGEHDLGVDMIRAAASRLAFKETLDEAEHALLKKRLHGRESVEARKKALGYEGLYKEKDKIAFSVRVWTVPASKKGSAPKGFCENTSHPDVQKRSRVLMGDDTETYLGGPECMTCARPVCRTCEFRSPQTVTKCAKCGEAVCNICGECLDWRFCSHRNQPVVESAEWQTMLLELDLEPDHEDWYQTNEDDAQAQTERLDRGAGIKFRLFQLAHSGEEVGQADILQDVFMMYHNLDSVNGNTSDSDFENVGGTISIEFREPISMLNQQPHSHHSTMHVRRIDFRVDPHPHEAHGRSQGKDSDQLAREWVLLRTIFDVKALRKRFDVVQARIINTPYVSDLEKWLLSDEESTYEASYLQAIALHQSQPVHAIMSACMLCSTSALLACPAISLWYSTLRHLIPISLMNFA